MLHLCKTSIYKLTIKKMISAFIGLFAEDTNSCYPSSSCMSIFERQPVQDYKPSYKTMLWNIEGAPYHFEPIHPTPFSS